MRHETITYTPRIGRRIVLTLFATQSLASAALIANGTVNSIAGAELGGTDTLAGLPGTLLLLGAAGASYPAGWLMDRLGRRRSLVLGFLIGALGMAVGGVGIATGQLWGFLLGLLLVGTARGATDQSRYAAADAQPPERRASAISTVVFAGTIGAVAGPLLVDPAGRMVAAFGAAPLAGPMLIGSLLFVLCGLGIAVLLRPDPRDIARALARDLPATTWHDQPARPARQILRLPETLLALTAMVIAQVVMVLVMSVVSLHMHHHEHGLAAVSLVMMAHTLGMFGLSVVNGMLANRFGRAAMIVSGSVLLIGGSTLAPVSLATPWLAAALFLVGLGWNQCYIAGSALLADALAPVERGQIQGGAELAVNLASAASSLSSGVILAGLGFGSLSMIAAALSVTPIALLGGRVIARAQSHRHKVT